MILNIVLIVILVLCLGTLVWFGLKKLPEIRVVDPSSSKESKARHIKYEILRKRLERLGSERAGSLKRAVLGPVGRRIQEGFRVAAGKLTALERKYAARQKEGGEQAHNPEVLRTMVREAQELMDDDRLDAAEKKLIEVVSHDPKNAAAYEHLGRLYLLKKDYAGAKETLTFLSRLAPTDASVLAALGEVAEAEDDMVTARGYYGEALALSPNNPKYIDFAIAACIATEDVHAAQTAIDHLREVNPENQKISEFEEQLAQLRQKKLQA